MKETLTFATPTKKRKRGRGEGEEKRREKVRNVGAKIRNSE